MDLSLRDQVIDAYRRHVERRDAGDWVGLADLFAEDARYFDPIFGWQQGREAIRSFLERAMEGLAERTFEDVWRIADGDRLVMYWQCSTPGRSGSSDSSGLYHGMSALRYAGDGLWAEQLDIYDREQAMSSREDAKLD